MEGLILSRTLRGYDYHGLPVGSADDFALERKEEAVEIDTDGPGIVIPYPPQTEFRPALPRPESIEESLAHVGQHQTVLEVLGGLEPALLQSALGDAGSEMVRKGDIDIESPVLCEATAVRARKTALLHVILEILDASKIHRSFAHMTIRCGYC